MEPNWKVQLNILWTGQFILIAMMAMSLPFWPLYISELGSFTPQQIRFWSAAIYIAPFFASIFSAPFWGKLGDSFGYKPMVIRACLGLFITQTLILYFSDVVMIFIFKLLEGLLAGFIVAAQSWAIAIVPNTERSTTIGKLQSATAVGNLMGPLLGGLIATYGGYHSIFMSSSIICAIITAMFLFLLESPKNSLANNISTEPIRTGKMFSYLQKQVLSILLVIILIQLARSMITPVFSLFVTEQLNGTDMTVGVLYAATGLMVFITAPLWGKLFDRFSQKPHYIYLIIISLLFACTIIQVLHAFFFTQTAIFILRLLWGVCLGALLPVLIRLLVDHAHERESGFFLGLGNSAMKFGNLIGIILGAFIEVNFGFTNSFLMTALLYAFAGLVLLAINPLQNIRTNNYEYER